ncbi:hypothetical protein M513_11469 [Trichuris suis]|uniref:Uncharacterized protein n=1 Tax=Trichuris suis TaxID=68888 RepID=A0A085LRT2_9BILA|nr:hypothetical protein M513_11469 [Trichuris suis]
MPELPQDELSAGRIVPWTYCLSDLLTVGRIILDVMMLEISSIRAGRNDKNRFHFIRKHAIA